MTDLIIATWNVNSVKSRLGALLTYLQEQKPSIVLLQELKCVTDQFPYTEIESMGYNCAVHGQKTYNGVAILSLLPLEDVTTTSFSTLTEEARYIEAVASVGGGGAIRVASVYVPNGQSPDSDKFAYKMRFFDHLYAHVKKTLIHEEVFIVGGDYNVAPEPIDVFDPVSLEGTVCYHPQERAKFRALEYLGLTDAYRGLHKDTQQFSWWDYRGSGWEHNKGLRIDHLLLSPEAADRLVDSGVDTSPRALEKPSDHTPVWCRVRC